MSIILAKSLIKFVLANLLAIPVCVADCEKRLYKAGYTHRTTVADLKLHVAQQGPKNDQFLLFQYLIP